MVAMALTKQWSKARLIMAMEMMMVLLTVLKLMWYQSKALILAQKELRCRLILQWMSVNRAVPKLQMSVSLQKRHLAQI